MNDRMVTISLKTYSDLQDKIEQLTSQYIELQEYDFQLEKENERYKKALKEISEYGGTDMLGKTCSKVAKEALS